MKAGQIKFSLNPLAVLWPGHTIELVIVDEKRIVRRLFKIEQWLLKLTELFIVPRTIESARREFQPSVHAVIKKFVEAKLLIPESELAHATEQSFSWQGLRLIDKDKTLHRTGVVAPRHRAYTLSSRRIHVIDDALHDNCVLALEKWFESTAFVRADVDKSESNFSKHWIYPVANSIEQVIAIPVYSWIDAVTRSYADHARLTLREVKAYTTVYGDLPTTHSDSEMGPTITTIVFLHQRWELDWAGELVVCDMSKDPQIAIAPVPGRIVVFRGDLPHRAGAPSRLAYCSRNTLVFRYSTE